MEFQWFLQKFEAFVGVNPWTMLFAWINLLILYLFLKKLAFKPLMDMITSRQKEIDDMYSDAESAKNTAGQLKAEYEEKKREKARARSEEKQRERAEKKIQELESELEALDAELFGEAATDYMRAAEIEERKSMIEEELLSLYELVM